MIDRPAPPTGFDPDPGNPGWFLRTGSDPTQDTSWWQEPGQGWVPWEQDPTWWYDPQGDVTKMTSWWTGGRIQEEKQVGHWYDPVLARARELYGKSAYSFGGDRTPGKSAGPWDCVGYVMECLDAVSPPLGDFKTGLHQGYINAERARQACQVITRAEIQPGDLIFFQKTYDTPGASHIGLIVDPSRTLMADDHQRPDGTGPGETDWSEKYWRDHFLSFGRVPR